MNNDLISRQAAIDAIYHHLPSVSRTRVRTMLHEVPSEQPERMKGKWERHYCEDGNPDGWRCDNCDEWYYFGQTLPNFCPNCGADMRGEQDE